MRLSHTRICTIVFGKHPNTSSNVWRRVFSVHQLVAQCVIVLTCQVPDDLLEEAKAAATAALDEMDAD